jgi:beta-glucanase (GH16 family)
MGSGQNAQSGSSSGSAQGQASGTTSGASSGVTAIGSSGIDAAVSEHDAAPGQDDASTAAQDAGGSSLGNAPPNSAIAGWNLVWWDEFDGPAGSAPDNTKWNVIVAGNNPNNELEYYTDRPQNVSLDGQGDLLLTARQESYMGANYTSGRLDTANKFQQTYGLFEARAKLPTGQGFWPAFWVLGNNVNQIGWPACGEIDIMENVGRAPTQNYGALHGPGYSGGSDFVTVYNLPGGYSSDFHVFDIQWEQNVIRWYVDGNLYETRTPADLASRAGNLMWVYDHPFYVILNLAVGGDFPGSPNGSAPFPQSLTVDYVRVYSAQ